MSKNYFHVNRSPINNSPSKHIFGFPRSIRFPRNSLSPYSIIHNQDALNIPMMLANQWSTLAKILKIHLVNHSGSSEIQEGRAKEILRFLLQAHISSLNLPKRINIVSEVMSSVSKQEFYSTNRVTLVQEPIKTIFIIPKRICRIPWGIEQKAI